jgi:CRISPR system Cascade subunit CasA
MTEISYNLLKDGWIPCRMVPNQFKLLSIENVLLHPENIIDVSSTNPLIEFSIYRLLLAILHRNFGPEDRKCWIKIYQAKKWDKTILRNYFEKWNHRFELFNEPENRFYQIEASEIKKKTPITKLDHALSTANNASLFDHSWDTDISPISLPDVAQLLIAFQSFAVSGGKSYPYYYSHAPLISGICTFLKGRTLFETLMLNFIRYDQDHPFPHSEEHEDMPFWERDDKTLFEGKEGRIPNGYLDYLTWQSRRLWLIPFLANGEVKVKYVIMAQGEKVKEKWNYDPQLLYKLNKKNERELIKLNPQRQVWRDIEALLRLNDHKSKFISPEAINWVSKFINMDVIPSSRRYNLEIYGLCNDPKNVAKIINWVHSYIPLSLKYLENQRFVDDIKTFIAKCETIEKNLVKTIDFFLKDYLFPKQSNLTKAAWTEVRRVRKTYQIQIHYWNQIEPYFYKFIQDVVLEPELKKRQEISDRILEQGVINTARSILNSIKTSIRNDPRALKSFIQNSGYFFRQLSRLYNKLDI